MDLTAKLEVYSKNGLAQSTIHAKNVANVDFTLNANTVGNQQKMMELVPSSMVLNLSAQKYVKSAEHLAMKLPNNWEL